MQAWSTSKTTHIVFADDIQVALRQQDNLQNIIEVIMDVGRPPIAYYYGTNVQAVQLLSRHVDKQDLARATKSVGGFGLDNRAGMSGTLHRICAMRNRQNDIIGLTFRFGRALTSNAQMVETLVNTDKSALLLGSPGVGKTSAIREISRKLSCEQGKRVVIIDTSNEIGGDGDVPHPAVGKSRRMHVPQPSMQHQVMIEAVQNHMPEILIIDEVSTQAEVEACRSIAERGVRLIATAHGRTFTNLLRNPELNGLIGGVHTVILGDTSASLRGGVKTAQERLADPTFPLLVELRDRDRWVTHDAASSADALLTGNVPTVSVQISRGEGNLQTFRTMYSESHEVFVHKMPGNVVPVGNQFAGANVQRELNSSDVWGGAALQSDVLPKLSPELIMDIFSLQKGQAVFYPYASNSRDANACVGEKGKKKQRKKSNCR